MTPLMIRSLGEQKLLKRLRKEKNSPLCLLQESRMNCIDRLIHTVSEHRSDLTRILMIKVP